jgi:hypothetical protein
MKRPSTPFATNGGLRATRKKQVLEVEVLPDLPSAEVLLSSLRHHAMTDHMEATGPWSVAAFMTWWYELDPTGTPVPHDLYHDDTGKRLAP